MSTTNCNARRSTGFSPAAAPERERTDPHEITQRRRHRHDGAAAHVEVISNNIANMTTTGYKRRGPEFQDLLYQSQRRIGATPRRRVHRSGGRQSRARREDSRGLPVHDRATREHREPLRSGDRRARALRGGLPRRRIRLHAVRQFPAAAPRPAGDAGRLPAKSGDHDTPPGSRSRCRSTRKAYVSAKLLVQVAVQSWASSSSRRSSIRRGLEAAGSNLFLETEPPVPPWPGRLAPRDWHRLAGGPSRAPTSTP